ncbi:hypothetical protein FGO68_gene221 [Halteria grandinella]|uniref:Uncharacterized protein n=1 Tax=Halteria grandinella TaxID=5974 RepID=A0A8J8NZT8_HALGN|nr:hypothetical protein FGO68_gene221 [Halteria grandinella]
MELPKTTALSPSSKAPVATLELSAKKNSSAQRFKPSQSVMYRPENNGLLFLQDITGAASRLDKLKSDYKSPSPNGGSPANNSPNTTIDARRKSIVAPVIPIALLKLDKSRKVSIQYSSAGEVHGSDSESDRRLNGFNQARVSIQDPTLDNEQFKKEIEKRLQDVKEPTVLDFGIQDHSLWDEITGHKEHQLQILHNKGEVASPAIAEESDSESPGKKAKPPSLWWIIYDCISKYPKFEQMKNFINESHRLKLFQDEEKRRKQIEAYLQKVKAKKGPGADKVLASANALLSQGTFSNDKALDSLLLSMKQTSTAAVNQLTLTTPPAPFLPGPHGKLEEMRTLLDSMQRNFDKSKKNLDRIKRLIRYRPPKSAVEDIVSDDEEATKNEKFLRNLSNIKSKISHLWKENIQVNAPQGQGQGGQNIKFEQVDEDDSFFEREATPVKQQPIQQRLTPTKKNLLQKKSFSHKSQSALSTLNKDIQVVQKYSSKRSLVQPLRHTSSNASFQTSEQLHYESLKSHQNLAEQLLQFAMDRLNQYYLLLEVQLEQQKSDKTLFLPKDQKKLLKKRHRIVSSLVELLRVKNFTYFTKETLFLILGDSKHTDQVKSTMDSGIFEAFHIIKVLKAFYENPTVNQSYETVLHKKMRDLSTLMPYEVSGEEMTIDNSNSQREFLTFVKGEKTSEGNRKRIQLLRPHTSSQTSLTLSGQSSHRRFQTISVKPKIRTFANQSQEDPIPPRPMTSLQPKSLRRSAKSSMKALHPPPFNLSTLEPGPLSQPLHLKRPQTSLLHHNASVVQMQRPSSSLLNNKNSQSITAALKALHIPIPAQPIAPKKQIENNLRRSSEVEKYVQIYNMCSASDNLAYQSQQKALIVRRAARVRKNDNL